MTSKRRLREQLYIAEAERDAWHRAYQEKADALEESEAIAQALATTVRLQAVDIANHKEGVCRVDIDLLTAAFMRGPFANPACTAIESKNNERDN